MTESVNFTDYVSVYFFISFQVDIVVGTPGRLEDLISTGKLALSAVRFFVLDEAVSLYSILPLLEHVTSHK